VQILNHSRFKWLVNLVKRKIAHVGFLRGMFNGHAYQVAFVVKLHQNIFGKIFCFGNLVFIKINQERIGIFKVCYFYGLRF